MSTIFFLLLNYCICTQIQIKTSKILNYEVLTEFDEVRFFKKLSQIKMTKHFESFSK
jgi:hypothetical protein